MGIGGFVKKMKVSELREIAQGLGVSSPPGKKAELITIIEDAVNKKLKGQTVSELKSTAKDLSIDVSGKKKKGDLVDTMIKSLDKTSLNALLAVLKPLPDQSLEEIGEELVDIERDVEGVMEKVSKMPSSDMADIYEIDKKLNEIIKTNPDYTDTGEKLDLGRVKYQDKNYIESLAFLSEAVATSDSFYVTYQEVVYAHLILSAEMILDDCREAESNDEKAADALIGAKRAFETGGERRKEAVELLCLIATRVHKEEIALQEDLMAKRESVIKAMKVQGVDVFNAERYLHRAREAFLVGDLSSSMTNLEKAIQNASESKDIWITQIEGDVPRVEDILNQASELGADITEAERHMSQAKNALETKDYSLCSELTKLAERKAMESQQSQIQKAAQLEREKLGDAQKILSMLGPLVQEAQLYHIDIKEINESIKTAREALQESDYVNAMTYAREAESQSKFLSTQLQAERDRILAEGGEFKKCSMCNSETVKVFDNGWARCMNCGQTFQVLGDDSKKKKKWGLFGK